MSNDADAGVDEPSDDGHMMWHYAALMIGFNECAKMTEVFGERVYFRLNRDMAEKEYLKLGGKIVLTRDKQILQLPAEGRKWITFTESDIEGMREAVAAFDAKKVGP